MLSRYTLDRKSAKRWQTLAEPCQRFLKEQQITTESPGTILRDVATLIEFVGSGGIVTKGRNANLPIGCLPELNRRTSYPIQPGLKRALLRDYPNVAGTFILLRVMDLLQARGNRLVVWPATFEFWRRLNPAEQYFALLEALLVQAQTSVLGGEIRSQAAQEFRTAAVFLGQSSPAGVEGVAASGDGSPCRQTLRWMNSQEQSCKRSSWIATTFTTSATATSAAIAGSIITPTPTKGHSRRKSPWPRRIWRAKLKWNSRSTTETLGSSRCVWRKLVPTRACWGWS